MENTTIAASPLDIPVGRLLPCPCCGAPASVGFNRTAIFGLHGWVSDCTICTDSASFHRFTRAAAVESWNNYASQPAPSAECPAPSCDECNERGACSAEERKYSAIEAPPNAEITRGVTTDQNKRGA